MNIRLNLFDMFIQNELKLAMFTVDSRSCVKCYVAPIVSTFPQVDPIVTEFCILSLP